MPEGEKLDAYNFVVLSSDCFGGVDCGRRKRWGWSWKKLNFSTDKKIPPKTEEGKKVACGAVNKLELLDHSGYVRERKEGCRLTDSRRRQRRGESTTSTNNKNR